MSLKLRLQIDYIVCLQVCLFRASTLARFFGAVRSLHCSIQAVGCQRELREREMLGRSKRVLDCYALPSRMLKEAGGKELNV